MNENSISFNNNNDDSENLQLPLIDSKLIPEQKDNEISKNENEKVNNNLLENKTFLLSKKTETEKFDIEKPSTIIRDEAIFDLLNEKIVINNNTDYRNIYLNRFKRESPKNKRINRYINEDILKNNPMRISNNKVKLKHVQINNILTETDKNQYEQDNNYDDDNYDKRLYNIRLYNFLKEEKEAKAIKPPKKKSLKKSGLDIIKSNWRKNITRSLDFKYSINKGQINEINAMVKYKSKNSKLIFDTFRSESIDMLEQIWNL